jgi:hypothetical protein
MLILRIVAIISGVWKEAGRTDKRLIYDDTGSDYNRIHEDANLDRITKRAAG